MERLTASTQNNVLVRARDNCSVWTMCLLTSYLLAALPKGLITQAYESLPVLIIRLCWSFQPSIICKPHCWLWSVHPHEP